MDVSCYRCLLDRSVLLCGKYELSPDEQTAGTAILTKIYNEKGWKPTGGTAVGFACAPILFLLLRSV
jgi:hypothetical protein